jgi:hypothetical protein
VDVVAEWRGEGSGRCDVGMKQLMCIARVDGRCDLYERNSAIGGIVGTRH